MYAVINVSHVLGIDQNFWVQGPEQWFIYWKQPPIIISLA